MTKARIPGARGNQGAGGMVSQKRNFRHRVQNACARKMGSTFVNCGGCVFAADVRCARRMLSCLVSEPGERSREELACAVSD